MDLRAAKRRSVLVAGSTSDMAIDSVPKKQVQPYTKPDYRIKLVTVGDGGTGKTCLLIRWLQGQFHEAYVPTVFENYTKTLQREGKTIDLALWDTAGQEEYDRLRALSYPETDVCLVCFSVDDPISLENAFDKWVPEIQTYCPGVPYILVGCKSDSEYRQITFEGGLNLAAQKGAHAYVECSSKTGDEIEEPFMQAVRAVLKPYDKKINKQTGSLKREPRRKISFPNYRQLNTSGSHVNLSNSGKSYKSTSPTAVSGAGKQKAPPRSAKPTDSSGNETSKQDHNGGTCCIIV